MRLAWFRPAFAGTSPPSPEASAWQDTALLVRALHARHTIDLIDARRAHDFVWQQARTPVDLCVFELDDTPHHGFVAAYAVHYPGIVLLRGLPRHDRALRASRLVVVPHEPVARAVADDYPGTLVRTLVPGVEPLPNTAPAVVEALHWPPDGAALTYAMAGMAAGRAVIVFDGPETADWPSLDPQNWQPRDPLERSRPYSGYAAEPGPRPQREPICVSIDPRDESHSLRLARRRLWEDASLRARLGAAARAWWRRSATVEVASTGFEALLEEARALPVPAPTELRDGTAKARRILSELGPGPWALGLGPLG